MAEVESSPGFSRMGFNGVATGETLKRRPLEDELGGGGGGGGGSCPLKYKRRNVVAKRDFPRGCGVLFSEMMKGVSKEGDGKSSQSSVGEESDNIVELESVRDSGVFGGSQASESLNGSVEAGSETSKISGKLEVIQPVKAVEHVESTRISQSLDSEASKPSETSDQVEELETVKAVEHEALAYKSQALDSEAAKPLKTSEQVEELETVKAVEHETSAHNSQVLCSEAAKPLEISEVEELETMKPLEYERLDRISQKLYYQTVKLLATLDQMKMPGQTQNVEESVATKWPEHSRQIELPELSKYLESQNTSDSGLVLPGGSVLPGTSDVSKVSDQPQLSVPIVEATVKSRLILKVSSRRASVIREFPPGCGINSHTSSREENLKAIDSLRDTNADEGFGKEKAEQVQVRTTSGIKLKQKVMKENSIRSPRQTITEVGIPNGKLGKEVKRSKDKSSKRMHEIQDEVNAVNQSHGTEIVSLDPSGKKEIVLALMAAPYCPWRQGKSAIKSSPIIGTARNKAKKDELMVMVQDKTASIPKKRRSGSENSEGKSKSKKLLPAEILGQLVLRDEDFTVEHHQEDENVLLDEKPQDFEANLIPFGRDGAKVTREKVRETLRLFQVIFRKFLQGEEAHSKDQGSNIKRIDLHASNILKEAKKWVNTEKFIGPVPGVEVGDEFHYRVELAIVGIHGPFQNGIESMEKDGKVLAISVVASGGYADDMDYSDVLIYSGQGGRPMSGKKQKQAEDQKLQRGNLALKNSMDTGNVVRVTRGFKDASSSDSVNSKSKITMTYTYDGLYVVEDYWTESSCYGTSVFKFKLRRIPGQPELAWKELKKSRKSKVREGLCVVDISEGKEKMLIGAVNTIDDEKPQPFTYVTKMIYPDWYNPVSPKGCDCTKRCLDPSICSCAAKNGGEIRFNYDGAIVEAKPLVYECGPSCGCPPSCYNRVSQRGIKFQLEVFKTESRGWGVRSLTSIPSGSFVCEYTGELLQDKEAEQRTGNDEYLFDIGHNYNDPTLWEGLQNVIPDLQPSSTCEEVEDAGYTIDAAQYGSVGRFINHSCSPNLYAQNVLYDHDDKRMPHIMLFAAENIPPLQELTYHYNYTIGQVYDAEGNVKEKRCYCGSAECSGRLY
ncbi:histone-lysine N-methyltransferase, H3 lysine-9 specific SUVH6-like [Macadamia integrifolia]|uniref:histone-lysine N-methyltransferase, H3 lysine-9 specific SUVH6-like n=1 Tax=Macadamia integrifolia TaxID=60698 RepID=UPI001C4F9442|nr:histone-lysine N-methyltransferase, H3 lysine-9 specific SUVH6-like [Macadamia integrifolia]